MRRVVDGLSPYFSEYVERLLILAAYFGSVFFSAVYAGRSLTWCSSCVHAVSSETAFIFAAVMIGVPHKGSPQWKVGSVSTSGLFYDYFDSYLVSNAY